MATNKGVSAMLTAALSGSKESLGQALEGCRGYLLHVAFQEMDPELLSKAGASDLVQETFLEAQRDFARFQGEDETALLAWVKAILKNNIANFTRQYKQTGKRSIEREVRLDFDRVPKALAPVLADPQPTPSS